MGAQQTMSAEETKEMYAKFGAAFTEKIDCSEDPYNPELGFNLHGVTLAECAAAKAEKIKATGVQMQLNEMNCIEQIVDESDNSAAVWIEFGNSGKYRSKMKVRGAVRYKFNADGKITGYHSVYDSYNVLSNGENALSVGPSNSSSAALAIFCVSALAATVYVIMKPKQKGAVLLADDA